MRTEVKNKSGANSSEMGDPDVLRLQVLHTPQLANDSGTAATQAPWTDVALTSSGIIPGAIAATVFIIFLLLLYAVLWKCMVSPPKRKKKKKRVRGHQRPSV
ncbi:unnamed protein product [Tetraodon nigroviridis]|uniref:(spotted green pufferfish) hypothetical protein n=1 Tax=Tetraodon nigroviridis TaxID=99883 RepID=Q4RUW2_TETNG|nr:unnamed protein product [Tetraodon nigroviridis]